VACNFQKPQEADVETFYETGDTASVLNVCNVRVHQLVAEGKLPIAARTPRGVRLFRPADVHRVAAERAKR
jgi:hypothetical protein